jgi:hypothetical protein
VTTRIVGVVLVVVGVAATLAGLGARIFLTDDEGHHDGRAPTFALSASVGADELVVDVDGSQVAARIERAGQTISDYDELHDGRGHLFVIDADGDGYRHVDLGDDATDGIITAEAPGEGPQRVVFQARPAAGPDLLELGRTVDVVEAPPADASAQTVAADDVWTDGELTIERQGLDFVLSVPWTGEEHHGGPAFLALFGLEDFAFVHGHAETPDADRFRFNLDLPGRGDYVAALELVQDGELVTALFRFTI